MPIENKVLHIGAIPYTVERIEGLLEESSCYADIDHRRQRVRVDDACRPDFETEVLVHEILHGFLEHAGKQDDHDEQDIEAIAHGLLTFLRDARNRWSIARMLNLSLYSLDQAYVIDSKNPQKAG